MKPAMEPIYRNKNFNIDNYYYIECESRETQVDRMWALYVAVI